jgi:MFS family permease
MSNEGVTLISRVALVAVLILFTAFVRVWVGPSRRRGLYMGIGALGGMAAGVAVGSLMSHRLATDSSAISVCIGIVAGWCVAWPFARRIPRETN